MAAYWRALGRTGRLFLALAAAFLLVHYLHAGFAVQVVVGFLLTIFGIATAYQLARRVARRAIWRLRNRLIVAYLFIAVVPIVLILALVIFCGRGVIGQMAVYLVDTELSRRENNLQREVTGLVMRPPQDPQAAVERLMETRSQFPNAELVMTGKHEARYPLGSRLEPPEAWQGKGDQHIAGLVARRDGGQDHLYVWAYAAHDGTRAVFLAPVTHELLAGLVKGLGDVNYTPLMGHIQNSHIPPRANLFDFPVSGIMFPVTVPSWESADPDDFWDLSLTVDTRLSGVLGIVFGQKGTGFDRKQPWSH